MVSYILRSGRFSFLNGKLDQIDMQLSCFNDWFTPACNSVTSLAVLTIQGPQHTEMRSQFPNSFQKCRGLKSVYVCVCGGAQGGMGMWEQAREVILNHHYSGGKGKVYRRKPPSVTFKRDSRGHKWVCEQDSAQVGLILGFVFWKLWGNIPNIVLFSLTSEYWDCLFFLF